MVFHWRLSDSKSPQVSRTLLSILAVFNNAVVWMVSTHSPTSKFSSPFNNPLVTVPKAPITIGIIVTFMFHSFFNIIIIIIIICLLWLLGHFPFLLSCKSWSLKKRIFAHNICNTNTISIYRLSKSSNSSQKCLLEFNFLPLFLNSSNSI